MRAYQGTGAATKYQNLYDRTPIYFYIEVKNKKFQKLNLGGITDLTLLKNNG